MAGAGGPGRWQLQVPGMRVEVDVEGDPGRPATPHDDNDIEGGTRNATLSGEGDDGMPGDSTCVFGVSS